MAPQVEVTMASAQTTPRAEETAEAPADEETLPESEPPTAQGPATATTAAFTTAQGPVTGTTAAFTDIQIPTWNLGERIPIAPQVWDADTPQVEVDLINLDQSEDTPAVPEDVKNSPKEKRKRKRRRWGNRKPMADWSYE
jgi:hypothetical protein